MKILVTGSSGFIGAHLLRRLRENKNYKVFELPSTALRNAKNSKLDQEELRSVVSSFAPNVVIHLAGKIRIENSAAEFKAIFEDNGLPMILLLDALIGQQDINLIYANSGGATYDAFGKLPSTEKSPIRPLSAYGLSKQFAEDVLRITATERGYKWTSLALSNCFGDLTPNERGFLPLIVKNIVEGKDTLIRGHYTSRDFIHVNDVTETILLAIDKPFNGRINVSANIEYRLVDVFNFVAKALKSALQPVIVDVLSGEVERSMLDNSTAQKFWNWNLNYELYEVLANLFERRK